MRWPGRTGPDEANNTDDTGTAPVTDFQRPTYANCSMEAVSDGWNT